VILAAAGCPRPRAPASEADAALGRALLVVGGGDWRLPSAATALVATAPDRALAVLGPHGLAEVDLTSGRVLRWRRPDVGVGALAAAVALGDGTLLATSSEEHRTQVWRVDTASLVVAAANLPGSRPRAAGTGGRGLAVSPDGRRVVICGDDLGLEIRDARSLAVERVLSRDAAWASPGFTADGNRLIALRDRAAHVFDVATGVEVARWPASYLAPGPGGRAWVRRQEGARWKNLLVDIATGVPAVDLGEQATTGAIWAGDGSAVAMVVAGAVAVIDNSGGRRDVPFAGRVQRVAFSRDGARLLATTGGSALWAVDLATGARSDPGDGNIGSPTLVAPIAGGVVATSDAVRTWDADGHAQAPSRVEGEGPRQAALAPGGGLLITASPAPAPAGTRTQIDVWDLLNHQQVRHFQSDAVISAVDIDDRGAIALVADSQLVRYRSDGTGAALRSFSDETFAEAIDLTGDRAAWSRQGDVAITDADARGERVRVVMPGCEEYGWAVLAHDRPQVATSDGRRLLVWDAHDGTLVSSALLFDGVDAVAFTPGRDEVTLLDSRRAIFWEPTAHRAVAIELPGVPVAVGWDPRGERIAIGFGDGRVALWRGADLRALGRPHELGRAEPPPRACGADPLAAPGDDGDGAGGDDDEDWDGDGVPNDEDPDKDGDGILDEDDDDVRPHG